MKVLYNNLLKIGKVICLMCLLCIVVGCSEEEHSSDEAEVNSTVYRNEKTVDFSDKALEKAIKKDLNQKKIYESDLKNVTSLSIHDNTKIKDWSELEKFQNLEELSVTECGISDISFIENLTNLVKVNFSDNKIKFIEPIKSPETLRNLILSNNRITELSFLEDFPQIQLLSVSGNKIEDIAGVEYCENLLYLDLRYNKIADVKGIDSLESLHTLYLDEEVEREGSIDFLIGNFRNGDVTTKQYLLKEQYDLE